MKRRALPAEFKGGKETEGEAAPVLARSAVFVELESESGGYRDVGVRIDQLSKVQAK